MDKPLKYATKKWELRAQETKAKKYVEEYQKQLAELVVVSVNGFSLSDAALHYAKIAVAASGYFQFNYMQTRHLETAEYYLYLVVNARLVSDMLLEKTPNTSKRQVQPIGEFVHYAIIGGYFDEAVSLISHLLNRLIYEASKERQLWIKQECNLYLQLLANNDAKANLCIAAIEQQINYKDKAAIFHALTINDENTFEHSLKQYIRNSRITPNTPDALNTFALCVEKLALRKGLSPCVDVAEAPSALLNLPSISLREFYNKTGIALPELTVSNILPTLNY